MTALNQEQQAIADSFVQFLLSDQPAMIIDGPAGTGKSFLVNYLVREAYPKYVQTLQLLGLETPYYKRPILSATTHKAAAALHRACQQEVSTIHSVLRLRVKEDYSTGKTHIDLTNATPVQDTVLFIDECSMIDKELYAAITKLTRHCKVVYVGDALQLPPVFESQSSVYFQALPMHTLTTQVRSSEAPPITALTQHVRDCIINKRPVTIVPDGRYIQWLDAESVQQDIQATFASELSSKIVTYSNNDVHALNTFVRQTHNYQDPVEIGEELIINSAFQSVQYGTLQAETNLSVLEVVEQISAEHNHYGFDYVRCQVRTEDSAVLTLSMPVCGQDLQAARRAAAKVKNWELYYAIPKVFIDARPPYASTIHKSQGSTYHTVYVDLSGVSQCTNTPLAMKLLYVALSRASHRIVLYGDLSRRLGHVQ